MFPWYVLPEITLKILWMGAHLADPFMCLLARFRRWGGVKKHVAKQSKPFLVVCVRFPMEI